MSAAAAGTMQLTVVADGGARIVSVEVGANDTVDDVKAVLEVETTVPVAAQQLFKEGRRVTTSNHAKLAECGVASGDMLELRVVRAQTAGGGGGGGGAGAGNSNAMWQQRAIQAREQVIGDAALLEKLTNSSLEGERAIAAAVLSNDISALATLLREASEARQAAEAARLAQIAADPFNPEYQRQMMEAIQQKNVDADLELAMEQTPEAFGRVVMLYVDVEINKIPLKAFVDSGAQQSIMSAQFAEQCGLLHRVDRRFSGTAVGVGTAKILGQVHLAQIKLGNTFLPMSITVMEGDDLQFLLGLDMLRRHQMCIDLRNNVLRVGNEALPFLAEKDIPKKGVLGRGGVFGPPAATGAGTAAGGGSGGGGAGASRGNPVNVSAPRAAAPVPAPAAAAAPAPATSTAGAAAANTGGGANANGGFPASAVDALVALGHTRQMSVEALRMTGGNVEMAASYLMGF